MKKFMSFVEEKLTPLFIKLGTNSYIIGIRDGMVATVPFTIFGSLFIILQQFPNDKWLEFIAPYSAILGVPNTMTIGIISLYVAFAVGYNLAKEFKVDALMGGCLSFVGFMILQIDESYAISTAYFGSKGIFTAILVAIFAVKMVQFFTEKGIIIKFPEGVPSSVAKSFATLIPGSVVLAALWVFSAVLGLNIPEIVITIFSPLVFALNSYPGILVFMVVSQMLWCVGIHGQSVLNAVGTPIFTTFITANMEAYVAGEAIPYITATGFIPCFISLGGAGATLGLCLLMARSKEKSLSVLGKLATPAGIFNINEPVIFGLPIVMNPIMMIPFILVDVILLTGTYFLMFFDIIGRPVAQVPWIMPPVLGAYLTTGGNIPAAIWALVGLVISVLVYYPFFKIIEKQRLNGENLQ